MAFVVQEAALAMFLFWLYIRMIYTVNDIGNTFFLARLKVPVMLLWPLDAMIMHLRP